MRPGFHLPKTVQTPTRTNYPRPEQLPTPRKSPSSIIYGGEIAMMMQFGRKLSGAGGKSTIFGPPARSLSPAEAQASFDQYSRTTWLSGKCSPIFATVPVSNPDLRTFSQKFAKFSEKTAPDTASPTIAHPRRVPSSNPCPSRWQ